MQAHALTRTRYFYSLNVFTSDSIQGTNYWVISPYVLSLRGLPLPPASVFVKVNEARSYFASTVARKLRDGSFTQLLYFARIFSLQSNVQTREYRVSKHPRTQASYKFTVRHLWKQKNGRKY
jgi:hypothetical protein